jgi:proteic killer suppression protein
MIKSWKHKGLRTFFEIGKKSGINSAHAKKIKIILQLLNAANAPERLNLPGMNFHKLKADLTGYFAVTVRANWRIIYKFEGEDAILVDYLDYH